MKKATCRDLRGACDEVVTGETADEMGQNCRAHVEEMMQQNDPAHMEAIKSMQALSSEDQQKWHADFVANFANLEDA